jgi:2,4-diketo-3-deoxy-L-fuconate hydrolase
MRGLSRDEKRARAEKIMDERAAHGRPYIFNKVPSSLTGPFDPIILPPNVKQPDWELELAVIIGKPARRVTREQALEYVAGYAVANDLSSRDLLFREDIKAMGTDWVACKNAPSWAPLGPYLVPAAFVPNPHDLPMTLKLNGKIMQDAKTNDMIFDIPRQIEYLSALVQLLPGDVICTGSPAGNGSHYNRYLQPGDVVECTIGGLGSQRNVCEAERP